MHDTAAIKDVIKHRWNRSSETYDCCPGHGIQLEQEKEAWNSLLKRAPGEETLDVLDVGCGTGVLSLLLSEIGHKVTGIDLSDGMLGRAKEKADDQSLRAEFRLDDAENLSFDVVISRHLLSDAAGPLG